MSRSSLTLLVVGVALVGAGIVGGSGAGGRTAGPVAAVPVAAGTFAIRDVRVFDGERVIPKTTVVVRE